MEKIEFIYGCSRKIMKEGKTPEVVVCLIISIHKHGLIWGQLLLGLNNCVWHIWWLFSCVAWQDTTSRNCKVSKCDHHHHLHLSPLSNKGFPQCFSLWFAWGVYSILLCKFLDFNSTWSSHFPDFYNFRVAIVILIVRPLLVLRMMWHGKVNFLFSIVVKISPTFVTSLNHNDYLLFLYVRPRIFVPTFSLCAFTFFSIYFVKCQVSDWTHCFFFTIEEASQGQNE